MILRATIENLYSFDEETEISFVAGKSTAHGEQISRAKKRSDISVLKAGIIYGANASGKSNIIKAISVLRKIALYGVPKRDFAPFKLGAGNDRPSKVELEIKVADKYYAYGVEFTAKGIAEEWLYLINSRSDKEVFTRKVVSGENVYSFRGFSGDDEARQMVKFVSLCTPLSTSFLSEYVERNGRGLEAVRAVYEWMLYRLKIISPDYQYHDIYFDVNRDNEFDLATKSLLEYFNTGIVDLRRTKVSFENIDLPDTLVSEILSQTEPGKSTMVSSSSTTYYFETDADCVVTAYKQSSIHKAKNGDEVAFGLKEESDGSVRLLDFIPMLIDFRMNEVVYLIDEIDRSMHPMLSAKLLEYYFEHLAKDRDTQLIFTTHESNLLDLNLIRADEVWFIEKDTGGASHLSSLAEYKPREDVRKGYLQGRYGAIPFFASTHKLKW